MTELLKMEFGWGTLKATDIVGYVPMIISKDDYKYITGQEYQETKKGQPFRRIDKLTTDLEKRTQERDDLKERVLSLKGQVKELEIKIDKLGQEFDKKSKDDRSEKYDKNSKY